MWLDRFSNHSTPTASPPAGRSSFQGPRRPSHLGQGAPQRPAYSPRSSSLNVSGKVNSSTTSLNSPRLLANGSTLRQEITPPPDQSDPLAVLEDILGQSLPGQSQKNGHDDEEAEVEKPDELVEGVDFQAKSLQDFLDEKVSYEDIGHVPTQMIEEYELEMSKFEDLHNSILACDDVLKSVQLSLANFQNDLGTVSAEIETLQNRSNALNTKLENRKTVEKILGPAIEEISIAPAVVKKLSDSSIDHEWVEALKILDRRSKAVESKLKESERIPAISDVKPLLDDLTKVAIEHIRDFLVSQIKSLRSPNINAQIIQQRGFLPYKDIFSFLVKHHPKLAEEIGQAYTNTMRWYYSSLFTRYKQALEKIPLYTIDKTDTLGMEPSQKTANVQHAPSPLALGRRLDIVTRPPQAALPSYVAEDMKTLAYIETPFHAFSTALVDNASFEYAFLTAFFPNLSFSQVNAQFTEIFSPTFALADAFTRYLVDTTFDCFGILLCVRIIQHLAFELQRRKCPVVDGFVNGTNMLLWPRFQISMDAHIDSMKRATGSLPSSSTRATLSLGGGGGGSGGKNEASGGKGGSTAPHVMTQRFGQFVQGILALVSSESSSKSSSTTIPSPRSPTSGSSFGSSDASASATSTATATVTTPTSRSLDRLSTEFESFLEKASKPLQPAARKERFLTNNYGLLLTILGDTGGEKGLAGQVKRRWEALGGEGIAASR